MYEHQKTDAYSTAFKTFLAKTNEKAVLTKSLQDFVAANSITSIIDIGAGNGDISKPLSQSVSSYVAIEQKPDFVIRLKEQGIRAVEEYFPGSFTEEAGMVLISHSLPPQRDGEAGWDKFLKAAWSHVSPAGKLVLITFEDEDSEWNQLVTASGLEEIREREERIAPLKQCLKHYGGVTEETIITHVRTGTVAELQSALAFVWSDGNAALTEAFIENPKVTEYLEKYHKTESGYQFPFYHYLLVVHNES